MADVMTPEQRSRCMSRIRSKDTKPEWIVRRMVHSLGFRYRLHRKDLPGKPDLVFPRLRKLIFVHGCFWHLHKCRLGRVKPGTNADFWEKKRSSNSLRDRRNKRLLKSRGWSVLVLWECQTKKPELIRKLVSEFLTSNHISYSSLGSNRMAAGRNPKSSTDP